MRSKEKKAPFQLRQIGDAFWTDCLSSTKINQFEVFEYRPKPEPQRRAWNCPADVPGPVCWLMQDDGGCGMVQWVDKNGVAVIVAGSGTASKFIAFRDEGFWNLQYSIDRITWKPCEAIE